MMEGRETYSTIKGWFLDCIFDICRDHWNDITWPYNSIVAFTYEEYSASYDSPIENLMLNVITLTMTGGWDSNQADFYKNQINNILALNNLDDMLTNLPKEEATEFLQDMRILKLIE